METTTGQDHCGFIRECVKRTRAQGSASAQITQDADIQEMPPEVMTSVMRGQIDFTLDRCWMSVDGTVLMMADRSLLYERRDDDQWTHRRLDGRYAMHDPRWMLELLVTSCRTAQPNATGGYEVRFDPQRVASSTDPSPTSDWTAFTGTADSDDGRITRASVRMSTESGDAYVEITLSLSHFGVPVTFTPPASEKLTKHHDYVRELFGEDLLRELSDQRGP